MIPIMNSTLSFDEAFAYSRKLCVPFFYWRGKKYHTQRADCVNMNGKVIGWREN